MPQSPIRTRLRSEPSSNPIQSQEYYPQIRKTWERIPALGGGTPTGNKASDYHPYGYAYGTSSAYMNQGVSYTNYNGLQVAWIRDGG